MFEPEVKIHVTSVGFIQSIQSNYVEGAAIPGIKVEDTDFIEATYADLEQVQRTKYYNSAIEAVEERPVITAEPNKINMTADGVDLCIISGLPVPCSVIVENVGTFEVDDGEFGFPTTLQGTYKIVVKAFPYQDKSWEVVAA